MNKTIVLGCKYSHGDLQYVRFESPILCFAFEPNNIIIYTRVVEINPTSETKLLKIFDKNSDSYENDKQKLKKLLGDLFHDKTFGLHALNGSGFETVIPPLIETINKIVQPLPITNNILEEFHSHFDEINGFESESNSEIDSDIE